MMQKNLKLFTLGIVGLLAIGSFFGILWNNQQLVFRENHSKTVQTAWVNLTQQGSYQFATTVEQITYPAPTINNAGRSSQRELYYINGETNLDTESMALKIWQQGGALVNQGEAIEIKVEKNETYGRFNETEWVRLEQFDHNAFAPGQDAASFLSAAKNVTRLNSDELSLPDEDGNQNKIQVTRYEFDVDSMRFADIMREQLVKELQRSGKLPIGMQLDLSDQYRDMVAYGTVWINADNLPVRLQIHMEMPPFDSGEQVKAIIATDFYPKTSDTLLAGIPLPVLGMVGIPPLSQFIHFGQVTGLLLGLTLVFILFYRSPRRLQLTIVALIVILSMTISPVWQGVKAAEFSDEMKRRQDLYDEQRTNAEIKNESVDLAASDGWNVHQDPIEATNKLSARLLEIGNTVDAFRFSFSPDVKPLMNTVGDPEADSDGDGLTDAYEDEYDDSILDKTKADTDGDGLLDGVELKLNLLPGEADSDKDKIDDSIEIVSFYYADKDWYSDPTNNDSDSDGILDGIECPERVITSENPTAGVCRDTDADGVSDIFDADDDGDGVPSNVDNSPLYYDSQVYSATSPYEFRVENMETDLPVILDLQIQPENKKHLTYIMNVLDWPSGDNDGQVMRKNNTTFGDDLTSDQRVQDPRASNGDMRLIPMLEFRINGDNIPFPLTNQLDIVFTGDDFNATFTATATSANQVTIEKTAGPSEAITLFTAVGNCEEFSSRSTVGTYNPDGSFVGNYSLGSIADGDRLFIAENASGTELGCMQAYAAHGNLSDRVVDVEKLAQYGASARNDENGEILVYAPLTLEYDYTESAPVSFRSRIPYLNEGDRLNTHNQEVRMIWMLNMLTDVCKPIPSDHDETDDGEWCDTNVSSRWINNVPRVVQTYPDSFHVTGMLIIEDHGVDLDVILENPATDADISYDDELWGLAYGLQGTYLSGSETMTLDEIYARFDADMNGAIPDGDIRLWGLQKDGFQVEQFQYGSDDDQYQFVSEQVYDVLDEHFEPYRDTIDGVTLLYARDKHQRSVSYDSPNVDCSGSACVFNFSGVDLITQSILNWAPYQWSGDEWLTYPLEDYLDLMEAKLRQTAEYDVAGVTDDVKDEIDGKINMARFTYETYFRGLVMLTQINGTPVVNMPVLIDDQQIYNQFYQNNAKAQTVTKVVKVLTEVIILGIEKNPNLFMVVGKTDKLKNFYQAMKDGAAQKLSKITNMLNSTLKRVAFGIALGVIIVGLAVCAILYLMNPDSLGGRIGGRILFSAIGLLTLGLGVMALKDAIAVVQAGKAVSNSVKGAAIVGAIIGVIITWGVFFYTWSASGASAGSLEFNSMLADAIAATMTVILMAALMATGVGAIIVAVVAIIDALIMVICAASGAYEQDEDHWARQYVCIGISGWVTKIFKWFIYSQNFVVEYDDEERLEFLGIDSEVQNETLGMITGNRMRFSVSIKNTITESSVPLDWKALAYFWQYSASNAKSATFEYRVQVSEDSFDGSLERGDMRSQWVSAGDDQWSMEVNATSSDYPVVLPAAGINRDPTVYVSEGAAIPVQECWAIPPNPLTLFMWIPVCYIRTYSNTFHIDMSESLTYDIFPATLDEFYTLTQIGEYGYALGWGRDATLTFPTLKDADGDGLISKAFSGGNDPDDSLYDTDNDGLSDYYELTNGMNPRLFDTDDDGLYDLTEIQLGTDPLRKDSDGDGLTDVGEVNGWLFVYSFLGDGTPLETMVYSNPLIPDSDFDGITDLLEKIYGFNPNAPSDPNILKYELNMREYDSPAIMLRFEEDNGATLFADSSNFSFDGFCDEGQCPVSGLTGRYGKAARFGGNQAVNLTTTGAAIDLEDNAPFTLSGWVNHDGGGTILSKWWDDSSAKNIFRLEVNTSGNLLLIGSLASVSSSISIPSNTWTHYAVVFDGSVVNFYFDGLTAGSFAWNNGTTYPDTMVNVPLMIGAYTGSSGITSGFNGYLDEVAVFDRALSQQEINERLTTARYNFNDSLVRPGEVIAYQSLVKNLLNNRFAYGLLNTKIDKPEAIVAAETKFAPKMFVLYPDNPVVTGVSEEEFVDTIQIDPAYNESTNLTITQTVSAQIVDRRTESNFAELWLKYNELSGSTNFEDSSGNMPPRTATCTTGSCPVGGESGVFNQSIKFQSGTTQTVNLVDLERLNLINRGYTISLWLKPGANSASFFPLLTSVGNRFGIGLAAGTSSYTPVVTHNGVSPTISTWRNIAADKWNNLVVVYSSSTQVLDIYINGAKVSSTSGVSPISANADMMMGGLAGANYWIDDLRIFSRPLSTLDISRLAERPVLKLSMDAAGFADSSVYAQSISVPKQSPALSSSAIRGNAMYPGTGSTQGYIQVNGDGMLNLSDGVFTISTWIYPEYTPSGTWQGIYGKRETGSESSAYPTLERLGNQLRFGFGNGSSYQSKTSGDILTLNQWAHVVVTFKPNGAGSYEYRLYLNSVLQDSYLFTTKPSTTSSVFYVGHSSHHYNLYIGRLNMDDEHDAGDTAEVYVEGYRNSSRDTRLPGSGEHDLDDGEHWDVNTSLDSWSYQTLRFEVWEEDNSPNDDDYCGQVAKYWYSDNASGWVGLSNGFDGSLYYNFTRNSVQFVGKIDEMEIYRFAIDTEQVMDSYNSIPITANLPLDDRPASERFENRSLIGDLDDGECVGLNCPAAGVIGLINQAVRFDGTDDMITIPASTTSDYMVSLWLNTSCENCGVFTLKNGSTVLHELYTKGGNICALSGTSEICSNGAALLNEQWHHVVYSNINGSMGLWLDGDVVNQLTGAAFPLANSATAYLGMAASGEQDYLSGEMDDVRIFRYSQPDVVIAQLKARAPFFLVHLDDLDGSDGINDDTPEDWVLDCAYNENNGLNTCPVSGVEGRLGTGMEFDAQNDILSLSQTALSSDIEEFSVSIWVKPDETFTAPQTLWTVWNQNNSAIKYSLALVPDSMEICVLSGSDSATCDADSNVSLIANNWNHVTFVVRRQSVNQETYQLYINGYLDSSGNGNGTGFISSGLGRLTIGNQTSGSNPHGPYGGVLDEVSIFSYALSEIDIRDTFHYQMEHVEETDSLEMTIDADLPSGSLISFTADFPYSPQTDKLMHFEAMDSTSGVAMVEMTTEHGENEHKIVRTSTVPLCLDSSSGTSFCPTLDPIDGDGEYKLSYRMIDQVGNQSFDGPYSYFVDGRGPRIIIGFTENQILGAKKHPRQENTWVFNVSGTINDWLLGDGNSGSGVDTETVRVAIFSEAGEPVGEAVVKPEIVKETVGYRWSTEFLFREKEPTGKLTIEVSGADRIGNETKHSVNIFLDASSPVGKLDEGLITNPDLVSDLNSHKAAQKAVDEDSSFLKEVTLTGTASDVPELGLPYMTVVGEGAVTQVSQVEMALNPALLASYQFNEPYPDGLLAWLPLDKEEVPLNDAGDPDPDLPERYFLDMSPYQISGVCEGTTCPNPGVVGHKNGSMYFNGDHQLINLGQNVDLAEKSFTVSLWAKRNSVNKTDPLLWQGPLSIAEQRFLFGFNAENQLVCGFGGTDLVTSDLSADMDWHYWACSYDLETRTRSLWKDGQLLINDQSNPLPFMNENLYIGQAPVGSFEGYLDELVILDRALSEEGIRHQFTAYQTIFSLDVNDDFVVSGDTLDDRSGYFHLLELSSETPDDVNKSVPGMVDNYGLGFDGDDHLLVEPAFSLMLDRASFTQMAWIYPLNTNQEIGIISHYSENLERRYPSIIVMPDQSIKVGFGNGYDWFEIQTEAGIVPINEWSFISTTFDGVTYKIYRNDQLVLSSGALSGIIPYGSNQFNLGENLMGMLDEVMIYPRALDPIEVVAAYNSEWKTATLINTGNEVNWQAKVPYGLEGPYNLEVRARDGEGHVLTDQTKIQQWGGVVDSFPPRLTILRQEPDPEDSNLLYYEFEVVDTMLDPDSIHQNLCEGIELEKEYFNSSWYLAGGVAPNSALYRIRGTCYANALTAEETGIVACDMAGNCSAQTYPAVLPEKIYLPLITGGNGQGSPVLPTQHAQLALILEKAKSWPKLADTVLSESDVPAPQAWIEDSVITYQDVRSMVHINLHGGVNHPESIDRMEIKIWKEDQLIVENQTAVFGSVWNGYWPFTPGEPPLDGAYQLELIMTDKSGLQTTVWETITVRLKP